MDPRMLRILEYDRVIDMLADQASSPPGREAVRRLKPVSEPEQVEQGLRAAEEGMDWLRLKGSLPLEGVRDIRPAIRRARIGGVLNTAELLEVAGTARAGRRTRAAMASLEEKKAPLPILRELVGRMEDVSSLEKEITEAIDEEGRVADQASPLLARLRKNIHQVQSSVRASLEQLIRSPHYQKMMQEPIVTLRNDRYVIPVKQEYRSAFGGIVHDQSASGQTVFIEPETVVSLNNRLRELEMEEEKEVERILRELSAKVRESADALLNNVEILTELDVIMAKARWGHGMKGVCPRLNRNGVVSLRKARHPLIDPEDVVPIDVELGREYRAIVITGPNTGGKTVSLKTIGLLSLLAQTGVPIPAEEESSLPVFSGIYADIGDEQSIEQNLSTFSGHMTHIIRMLDQLDDRSLVLLDELGAGTDPTEGAALAVAILEHLLERGCRVVATTHYNELKVFAHAHPDVMNASVEFDVETLRPTYRLLIGIPGRSNAFDIVQRLGMPREIVRAARAQLSADESRMEDMISALAADRKAAEEERARAESLRMEAEEIHRELEQKRAAWEAEKSKMREAARREARTIVSRARREAEEVLQQLRKWAREQPGTVKEHQLIEAKKRLDNAEPETDLPKRVPQATRDTRRSIRVGDEVMVLSIGQKGQVIEDLGNDEYQVQVGFIKIKVRRKDLEWKGSPKDERLNPGSGFTSYRGHSDQVRHELDLRGKMVDEAIPEIDKYLDAALLAGYQKVSLIHGKGTGALRSGVHRFLDQHAAVKHYRLGGQGEGGSGVTIVELR